MRWCDLSSERQRAVVAAAAARLSANRELDPGALDQVTIADLADYARGRPLRQPEAAIRLTLRREPVMRHALDLLLDRYASVSLPLAAAASTGATRRRRQADIGVEVEWLESSVEPNTVFVRVVAPASVRPVRELILRGHDGDVRAIALEDAGDAIEVLLDRRSPEFVLLQDEESKLWLR